MTACSEILFPKPIFKHFLWLSPVTKASVNVKNYVLTLSLYRSHLQDLKEVTHNIHYETYRAKRLNDNGGLHPISTSNSTQESNL